jgi:plastocyanin
MARFPRYGNGARLSLVAVLGSVALVSGLFTPSPVAASERPGTPGVAVALPNGTTTGFAPNIVAVTRGGSLNLVGADTQVHNLACIKRNRRTKRPLCQSDYAGPGEIKPVVGVEKLKVGTYALICQLHPQMKAELRVVGP